MIIFDLERAILHNPLASHYSSLREQTDSLDSSIQTSMKLIKYMSESLWRQIIKSTKFVTKLSKLIAGTTVAFLLLIALLYWANISSVTNQIQSANIRLVVGAVLMTAIIIITRTIVASSIYSATIDKPIDNRFYMGYPVVGLFRAMLPGGYITGSLVSAYVLGRSLDKKVGPLLIALAVSEVIHAVASVMFFSLGFILLNKSMVTGVPTGRPISTFILAIIVLLTVVFIVKKKQYIMSVIHRVTNYVMNKSPLFKQYLELNDMGEPTSSDAFALLSFRFRHNKRSILIAGVFAMVTQAAVVLALYMSVHGVGGSISLLAAIVILLPSRLGGLGFLPGGLGGVESALTALLIVFTDLGRNGATAGTILYRATTFWVEAFIGIICFIFLIINYSLSE